jgi:hypothetical protein
MIVTILYADPAFIAITSLVDNCLNIRHLVSTSCTILAGCHFHYLLKLLVKVRKIIESAVEADSGNI